MPRWARRSSPVSRNPASSLGGRRGAIAHRGDETGSLRTPPTAKQAAQSRQGGDEGGFSAQFPGFCRSRRTARRAGRAHRATLSVPVSSLDFREERLRRRLPSGCSVYATVATHGRLRSARRPVSDDRAAVTGIGHLVCRSLRTASAIRTTAEVVHDERRPLFAPARDQISALSTKLMKAATGTSCASDSMTHSTEFSFRKNSVGYGSINVIRPPPFFLRASSAISVENPAPTSNTCCGLK